MAAPFVGRAEELETLADLDRRVAEEGRPGAALILGPPGQGKSRLLAEAAGRSALRTLTVTGYEPEREVPLAAGAGLLRELSRVPDAGGPLAALLAGELGGGGALEPVRVLEAAHRARRATGPVLIAVDDLQWVDDLTLALCHYLVRGAAEAPEPLALAAASRPSSRADRFVAALEHRLTGCAGVAVIDLPPLAEREALELARAAAPGISDEDAGDLVRRAAGSPFWVHGLARGGAGPDAARVVLDRLGEVAGDARGLVLALAVAGRPIPSADLERLMEWPPDRTAAAVGDAVAQGLAIDRAEGVALAHELIREGALDGVSGEARRVLHRRLAEAIEREAGDDPTGLRAALAHRRAAGEPSVDLALRIARSPRTRLLGEEGLRELAEIATAPGSEAAALELREQVAQLAAAAGDHGLALEMWSRLADEIPDADGRRRAALSAGWSAFVIGRDAEARAFLREVREAGPRPHEGLSADALEASVLIWLDNRVAEGSVIAARASGTAHATAAAAGGCELLGDDARRSCLQALGVAFDAALRADDAKAIARIAGDMVHASRGFDQEAHLDALRHVAVAAYEAGRLEEAATQLERVCDEAHRRFLPAAEVRAAGYLARALLLLGRLDEAEAAVTRVERIPAAADLPGWRHLPRVRCEIELLRGDPQAACDELARLAGLEENPHARLHAERKLLQAVARLGGAERADDVARMVEEAGASAAAAGCANCAADLDLEAAEALARVGRTAEARARLAGAGERAGEHRAMWRRWAAALAAGPAEGADGLARVLEDAEHLGRRVDALWAGLDLAAALEGDRARAEAILRRVESGAEGIGSATHAALARRELRRLGVRAWRRGPARPDALTDRELQIATMAATGASNPEIARRVFLSRKTVERHVSAALAKLGARNRTELAGRLAALAQEREPGAPGEGPPP
jgi:DNA-binding NarL/FixJ family response regulator